MAKTFTQYLQNQHAKHYMGTDDNMPEAFEKWLSELSTDQLIEHADDYATYIKIILK